MIVLGAILISIWIMTNVANGKQKDSTIAQLITQQAQEAVAAGVAKDTGRVTVHGKLYFILVLKNRINPMTYKVDPNSGPTKIYVDTKNYPVFDPDIVQKIGLIDLARIWQQKIGSPESLYKIQTQVNERWKIHAQIEYEDAIVKAIPTGLTGALVGLIVKTIKEKVSDPITELRDNVAKNGFLEIWNNYLAAQKIARNRIEDYDVARKYLEHYCKAEAYERAVFSLLEEINQVHKSKMDRIGEYLLKKLPALLENVFSLTEFVELALEGKKAVDLEWKYINMRDAELRQVQEKLSKLYEAAAYTIEIARMNLGQLPSTVIDAYNRAGGPSVFGDPFPQNYTTPSGVPSTNTPYKAVELSRGGIYESSKGVFVVYGAIYQKYKAIGGPRHFLGLPVSNEADMPRSPLGTTGRYSRFERGSIYWIREKNQTFLVQGAIFEKWASLGYSGGQLGFPTSDEYPYQGGARSDFEGGYIIWTAQTGAQVVYKIAPPTGPQVARPEIVSNLRVLETPPYKVGQIITAEFSIRNSGTSPITFDVLTARGRLNGQCPQNRCPDFEFKSNVALSPNVSYTYRGTLKIEADGNYNFFTAYRTKDGKWNTSIPTTSGVKNTLDIYVAPSPVATPTTPPITPLQPSPTTPPKEPIISKSIPLRPYPSGQKYYLRVFNVDDVSKAKINGREILSVGYYNERELDITGYLMEGKNSIDLTLENISAGWTYAYTLRQGNNVIWNESCGRVGVEGCRNNDQTKGIVARHVINLSLTGPAISTPTPSPTIPPQPSPIPVTSINARIDAVDIIPKSIQTGGMVTLRLKFTNAGNVIHTFIAGASLWRPNDYSNPVANFERSVVLSSGQTTEVTWSYQPNIAGNWGYQFAIWKQKPFVSSNLLVKQPSPIGLFSVTTPPVQAPKAPTTPSPAPCSDGMSFVGDVNIPDRTQIQPGQRFTKTWRLRNTGSCSWGNGYILAFFGGSQLGAPSYVSVPSTSPNGIVDISVPMVAPNSHGFYQGFWQIRNPKGQTFGPQIWVKINVVSVQAPTPAPKLAPPPATTPAPAASPQVISGRIDSYSPGDPNNPVRVKVGGSVPLTIRFTNTGNTAWRFIVGASVWDSKGNIVGNYSTTLSSPFQPGQQSSVSWSHQIRNPGEYWVQFGLWKATPFVKENLLDKKPSPAQRLINGSSK